ncbi:MAG: nucleotidyltransferase family protein [Tannerella sp.]|jgi:NDP-sugar pyrophosphorylase family protein|nr:nucleotidyltransferase family protein [Tannerella sp.]
MKAMILAAGLGTRLKPLTDTVPKALIPIQGKPLLEHLIRRLAAAGFREIVVNVHHLAGQIIDFLKAHDNFGLDIRISDERACLLDTGGGIKHAASYLNDGEPFLVHNVDILSDIDLRALYKAHCQSHAMATLLVSDRPASRRLLFDKEQRLCGWQNRQSGEVKSPYADFQAGAYTGYAFGGIHVLSPEALDCMETWSDRFSIIDFYLNVCPEHEVQAWPVKAGRLLDVGKPETLAEAEGFPGLI